MAELVQRLEAAPGARARGRDCIALWTQSCLEAVIYAAAAVHGQWKVREDLAVRVHVVRPRAEMEMKHYAFGCVKCQLESVENKAAHEVNLQSACLWA